MAGGPDTPEMKRILALDGGGIRGVFSLMVLREIERLFRRKLDRPNLVLRDAFHFFAGTSTGAIIAAFLAWGKSVDEVVGLYEKRSREMFARASLLNRLLRHSYQAEAIGNFFKSEFVEADGRPAKLDTARLRMGGDPRGELRTLMMMMRNASTGSPWPVSNNPLARYNQRDHPECNLDLELWQLLRASTAAPTYFPPEVFEFRSGRRRIFIDGGLTPHNNPALAAVLMATLPAYRMDWPTGPDRLHVVSIGTGATPTPLPEKQARKLHKLDFAQHLAPAMIDSDAAEQDKLCRILGDCLTGDPIDSEIGDLRSPSGGLLPAAEKKFTYVRYDTPLALTGKVSVDEGLPDPMALDNLDLIPELKRRGEAFAREAVKAEHFFPPFRPDPTKPRRSAFPAA